MALGTEVNLGPGDVVLDGDRAPPLRGTAAPLFSTHVYCGHGRPSQLLLSSCLVLSRMTGRRANSQMLESADFLASKSCYERSLSINNTRILSITMNEFTQ